MTANDNNKGVGGATLTNPNKSGEKGVVELKQMSLSIDPLGVMPDVGHLLPADTQLDLTVKAKKPEKGAERLKNRKREEFCQVLTGWGADGKRKKNHEAYTQVYGKSGATARTQSSWLLSIPEVKDRVEWLERKMSEVKRHDYMAAQQEIDELRLGLIERAKINSKLAPVALIAARDFENAHGLSAQGAAADTIETSAALISQDDGLGTLRAALVKVVKTS